MDFTIIETPDKDTAGQYLDFSLVRPYAENPVMPCLDF